MGSPRNVKMLKMTSNLELDTLWLQSRYLNTTSLEILPVNTGIKWKILVFGVVPDDTKQTNLWQMQVSWISPANDQIKPGFVLLLKWLCTLLLKKTVGKLVLQRWGQARMGFPKHVDTILTWTELVFFGLLPPVQLAEQSTWLLPRKSTCHTLASYQGAAWLFISCTKVPTSSQPSTFYTRLNTCFCIDLKKGFFSLPSSPPSFFYAHYISISCQKQGTHWSTLLYPYTHKDILYTSFHINIMWTKLNNNGRRQMK